MALSANTVIELRTTGLDTNSGGYVTGSSGTDFSRQSSPQYSVTDGVTAGTTAVVSATANFGTDVVGNLIYITGGTGSVATNWYQIISRTNATTIVVDRSTGLTAGTGATLHIGGAMLTPGIVSTMPLLAANVVYIQTGTYSITSASTNIAGGCLSPTFTGVIWEGYAVTRGDLGTPPLFQASGISTATIFTTAASSDHIIRNVKIDGASLTAIKGFAPSRSKLYLCTAINCTAGGFAPASTFAYLTRCAATGCSTVAAFTGVGTCFACDAYSNTITGFSAGGAASAFLFCKSYNNSGATTAGFTTNGQSGVIFSNCTAYNNGQDGYLSNGSGTDCFNSIAETNGRYGFNLSGGISSLINCAVYNNTTANLNFTSTTKNQYNLVTGTSTFFTNAAGGDFSLNNVTGGGAAARAQGLPGPCPDGTTTGYIDIGTAQHKDAGGLLLNPSLEGL